MSTISSILLFLLCLPFHACNARLLAATDEEPEKKVHLSSKNDQEKVSPVETSVLPKAKPDLSNKIGEGNIGDNMLKETGVDEGGDHDHKPISSKADKEEPKNQGVNISGALQTESLVSASWRVPHRKRGEQQPGFNSDYSPPKTHPPVHN